MLTMVLVAKDVVEKDFLSVPRDTNALDAARQMKAKRHGFAIIASSSASPEGIVTEWDYLSKIVAEGDRKSTRLNSSHLVISYAVFCLKKKKKNRYRTIS